MSEATTEPTRLQDAMRAVEKELEGTTITVKLPPGTEIYANDIRRFVDAMLYKLGKHRSKGHWEAMPIREAMKLLAGEYKELNEAVEGGNTIETILEAADVANYALIVASIVIDNGHEPT